MIVKGVSGKSGFFLIVLPIGIAYWPLLFPCGRTGPCYSFVEVEAVGCASEKVLKAGRTLLVWLGGPGSRAGPFWFGLGGQGPGPDRLIRLINLTVTWMLI